MEISFTFRIPKELLEQLRLIAAAQDMTVAQALRKLVRDAVSNGAV